MLSSSVLYTVSVIQVRLAGERLRKGKAPFRASNAVKPSSEDALSCCFITDLLCTPAELAGC